MNNKTLTIGEAIISEAGILIPSDPSRKEKFIAWQDVQTIEAYKNSLRIRYTSQTGNLRPLLILDQQKAGRLLRNYWREALCKEIAVKGDLSGSIYFEKWPLKIGAILGGALGAYPALE